MANKLIEPTFSAPPVTPEQPKKETESILARIKGPEVPQPGSSYKPVDTANPPSAGTNDNPGQTPNP